MRPGASMGQMRAAMANGGDLANNNRCLAYCMKFQLFKQNYINYIRLKLMVNNYITQCLMSLIMLVEQVLEKQCIPKQYFFPIRGYYPIFVVANLIFIKMIHSYAYENTPTLLFW